MGFKNKKIVKSFTPIDLNEENVETIFQRCLATASTTEKQSSALFRAQYGFENTSAPISFDRKKILENKEAIKYLYGQLQTIHSGNFTFAPSDLVKKYSSLSWTNNKGILMEFLHLGNSIALYNPFQADSKTTNFIQKIKPTLSPKDPKFAEWYKDYETSEGPTPDEK